MSNLWDVVRFRMVVNHIEDLKELSRLTGLGYQNLRDKIKRKPETLRVYEIQALDSVLHFTDEELNKLLRGFKA